MSETGCSAEGERDYSAVPRELRAHCFKPGQSGNPGGRPKKKTLEDLVRERMDQECPGKDHSNQDELARVFVEKVVACDQFFFQLYLERIWPVPKQNGRTPETAFDQLLVYMIEQYEARLRVTPEGEPLRLLPGERDSQPDSPPLEAANNADRTETDAGGSPPGQQTCVSDCGGDL